MDQSAGAGLPVVGESVAVELPVAVVPSVAAAGESAVCAEVVV